MTDIDDLLRADGQRWRDVLGDSNAAPSRNYPLPPRHRLRLAVAATAVATAAAAVVIAAVAHFGAGTSNRSPSTPALAGPTNAAVSEVTVPTEAGSATLTLQLQIDAQAVRQGMLLGGTLTIINNTLRDVDLRSDCNFPTVEGELVSPTVPARTYLSGGVGCGPGTTTIRIKPGDNPFRFTIPTTYLVCSAGTPADGVACGPHGSLPNLPVGSYATLITVNGFPPDAKTPSVNIRVTP